jgi:hypothetical protein
VTRQVGSVWSNEKETSAPSRGTAAHFDEGWERNVNPRPGEQFFQFNGGYLYTAPVGVAMDLVYNDRKSKPRVGDVVMAPGNIRGIVIGVKELFVTVLGIGTNKDTGDTFVLPQRYVHDFPAGDCMYMEKQILNL